MMALLLRKSVMHCRCGQAYFSSRIDRVLIANRGEIACRVMRTARKLGIKTVAVFSEADSNAMHVSLADESYYIGPAPSQESYLCSDKLISVAKNSKCKAVHPGYGFLSENAEFATQCLEEGIIFIGPPANAIRDMGIKSTSKNIMTKAGVPVIKGYHGNDQSDEKLKEEAKKIGFPVMIKAVRGGGGKGMRIAKNIEEFQTQLDSARTEALKSFGNADMLLEKFVEEPRHVEVQIFGDVHGNYVHLFERDCSIQRRHQKVIEEAPAPGLTAELRTKLGETAKQAAKAVGYVGAGTVEFILDKNTKEYYFMEMNTRLQVEHPVTEMVTNTDLVEWQFKVANGEKLPLKQEEILLNGHAFEARIYAEDPKNQFLPGAGKLEYLKTPVNNSDVRVETGVRQGDDISVYYDPMIAKLVVWGSGRDEAILKFHDKLTKFHVAGLETNINFLLSLSEHSKFKNGEVHTNFIPDHSPELFRKKEWTEEVAIFSVFGQIFNEFVSNYKIIGNGDPFVSEGPFRLNHHFARNFNYELDKNIDLNANVIFFSKNHLKIKFLIEDRESNIKIENELTVEGNYKEEGDNLTIECRFKGRVAKAQVYQKDNKIHIFSSQGHLEVNIPEPKYLQTSQSVDSRESALSPMPGVIDKIFVKINDVVKTGDPLLTIIAMKMEYVIRAPKDGKIEEIFHSVGDSVAKNAILVKFAE